jgi:hypothetical protein
MQESPIWQRLLAALAYVLPWSDAIPFGQGLFGPLPWLRWLTLPALPVLQLQELVPFGSLVLFLVLFLAVARNPRVPYGIRFNVLQAILIDIVVVLVSLAFQVLQLGALDFVGKTLSNTVFIGILVLVLFAVVQNLRGKEADIPSLSEAVRMQL